MNRKLKLYPSLGQFLSEVIFPFMMYAMKLSDVANRRAAGEKLLDPITPIIEFQLSKEDLRHESEDKI